MICSRKSSVESSEGRSDVIEATARKYAEFYPSMDALDAAITYWFLEINRSLLAVADRAFTAIGQDRTRIRYAVLRSLLFADDEKLTHSRLVAILHGPPSTVSFVVDGLEREGLVARKPHKNRRAAWIQLTPLGKRVASEAVLAIARSMHEITDSVFSPQSKQQLRSALVSFYVACEQWSPAGTEGEGNRREQLPTE
jgi:DNA-binding MarR family transcriptional regulator